MAKKIKINDVELKEIKRNKLKYNNLKDWLFFAIGIILLLVIGIVILVVNYVELESEIEDLNNKNIELEGKNEELRDDSLYLSDLIGKYDYYYTKEKLYFMDESIVFVIEGYGKKYYTYDCMMKKVGDKDYSFWAYNVEAAKGYGYKKGGC